MSPRPGTISSVACLLGLLLAGCDLFTDAKPDRTAPAVTISAPAAGSRTRAPTVEVSGSARDTSGVERVAWALNSTDPAAERPLAVTPGREVAFTIPVSGLVAGNNTVTVFAYDRRGNRGSASVAVSFLANRAPVAADDSASTRSDSTVTLAVLPNDGDPDGDTLRVDGVSQPEFGISRINQDGTVTLVPDSTRFGTVSFSYVVYDRFGAADTARVTVTVRPRPATGRYAVREITIPLATTADLVDLNDRGQVLVYVRSTIGPNRLNLLWENGQSTVLGETLPIEGGELRGRRVITHALDDAGRQLFSYCTAQTGFNFKTCTQYGFTVGDTATGLLRGASTTSLPEGLRARLNATGRAILLGSLWEQGTRATLPAAQGRSWTPVDLGDALTVVGTTVDAPFLPVLYRNGLATLLAVGDSAGATDVNEAGQVVGTARDASGRFAFLWQSGTVQRLPGTVAPGTLPRISERGEAVYVADAPRTVFFYRRGALSRLDDLLADADWETTGAAFINDVGQIAAYARRKSTGTIHPVLLTPVP